MTHRQVDVPGAESSQAIDMTVLDAGPVEGPGKNNMRNSQHLSDGHHVDDARNLISCAYVDFRDPAERVPITALQKASSKRRAIPGCGTIRISKPSWSHGRTPGAGRTPPPRLGTPSRSCASSARPSATASPAWGERGGLRRDHGRTVRKRDRRGEHRRGELRRGMERDTALNFLRQLGGASGVHPAGMAGHTAMAGSPAAGAASLGTPGRGGGGALMMGGGGPMSGAAGMAGGAASLQRPGLGAAGFGGAAPLGAGPVRGPSGLDGGLNGVGFLQMVSAAATC